MFSIKNSRTELSFEFDYCLDKNIFVTTNPALYIYTDNVTVFEPVTFFLHD